MFTGTNSTSSLSVSSHPSALIPVLTTLLPTSLSQKGGRQKLSLILYTGGYVCDIHAASPKCCKDRRRITMQLAVFFCLFHSLMSTRFRLWWCLVERGGLLCFFCAPLNLILTTGLCLSASLWW